MSNRSRGVWGAVLLASVGWAQPSARDAGSEPASVSVPGRQARKSAERVTLTSSGSLASGLMHQVREYRIGPGDVLQVAVWKEPDASNPAATVRPDGRISVPMVGDLQASGVTPAELGNTIAARYQEFIRNARVTVIVKEVNSQRIYLIGEVKREGPVRLQAPMTVLQALAEAGGVTDYAKRKKIYILRTEGERQLKLAFNYDAVVRGDEMEQNVLLSPGDTIVVPR